MYRETFYVVILVTQCMLVDSGFAKKTLLKTARKAGFKQKASSKRQKYVLPNVGNNVNKYMTSPGRMNLPVTDLDDLSGTYCLTLPYNLQFNQ